MTLRRLLASAPLVLLVAYLAHAVGFGTSHAPGGAHGGELLGGLLAALALAALVPVLWLGFGRSSNRSFAETLRALAANLPGSGNLAALAAVLAGGGGVAFAAIEISEGHSLTLSWAIAGLVLAAVGVAALAGVALAWLARFGLYIAALGARLPERLLPAITLRPPALVPATSLGRGTRRGRAPPRLA
jgi:hypothetical protein